MPGTPEALYDAHAVRLYAYCWSLVGDDAADAVRDTFVAAVQHPPRGDAVLWLYALSRSACLKRGPLDHAFTPGAAMVRAGAHPDPLLRAAAGLRADHREVLVLSAGEWLDVPDIATVLGIAPDTARQLLQTARSRLEGAVLDRLMREPGSPYDPEIIAAFEKGALPRLLARRAPDRPPHALREQVLADCAAEAERPLPSLSVPSPVVVIGPVPAGRADAPRRRGRGFGTVAGLAASAAAAVGMLAAWAGVKGPGEGALTALSPSSGHSSKTAAPPPLTSPGLASSGPATGTSGPGPGTAVPRTSASHPHASASPTPGTPTPSSTPSPSPSKAPPSPDPSSPAPTDPPGPTPSAPESESPTPTDDPSPETPTLQLPTGPR